MIKYLLAAALLLTMAFVTQKNVPSVPPSFSDTPKQYNFRFDGQSLSWIDAVLVKSYNNIGLELSRAKSDSLRNDLSVLVMYFRDQRNYQDTVKNKKP
jgi:hypothetical protein